MIEYEDHGFLNPSELAYIKESGKKKPKPQKFHIYQTALAEWYDDYTQWLEDNWSGSETHAIKDQRLQRQQKKIERLSEGIIRMKEKLNALIQTTKMSAELTQQLIQVTQIGHNALGLPQEKEYKL